jgi:hypothetical protein
MEEGGFSKRLNPTAWVRALRCNSVYITRYRSMRIPVSIRTSYFMADKRALVDSGATDNFMHAAFATRMGLGLKELPTPKKIFNIDNTTNKSGKITHYLDLDVCAKGIHKEMRFLITDIGSEDLLLGYPWLATFEPKFNWRHAVIDERMMPIIISSVNPRIIRSQPVIATLMTNEAKRSIVRTLETQSTIRGVSTELAIQAGQNTKATVVPPEYARFHKLFSDAESSRFPPSRPWDHAIDFKPNAPDALPCKVYPMTQGEDQALLKFLKEQEAKGYIRPSISPYASPFFFIQKKDGKLRPVQDYRRINDITISNQYPLPLITDLLTDLSGASIFTKLDVRDGYNNIRIKEGDEHKAAFKTKYGLYEPLVMFFGLKNSPATFQNMMNYEYRDTIDYWNARGTAIRIYMDDIAIATSTNLADHIQAVSAVFEVAERLDLYFKPEKCTFHAPRMDYLGVILEKGITRMDPVKIAGIKNWPTPTKVKDIRSFLGFCNFYRPFIRGFAHVARPLNELTRKDVEWTWTKRHQKAFEELRNRVTSEPVLAHPELDKPFELEVDASGFAIGAVLLQKKEDGKKHPIAYFSKTLNEAQRNYDVADLELLAVVMSLDNWRSFLAGSPHKVIVYSDHQNLLYWKEPHKISRRVAREVLRLSEYNIEIRHIQGKSNGRADALSRRPDYDQGTEDNTNVVVLPEHVFANTIMTTTHQHQQSEECLKPWIDPHQLKSIDGTWYKGDRVVVTADVNGKRELIKAHHDLPIHGHPGISKTIQIVERNYWWPQMRKDITDYIQGCADCQRHKVNNRPTKAPLRPIYPKPEAMPFETIALDFITKLPVSQGYDSILTVTDHDCTKASIFIPCNEEINAEGTAALYVQHVFAHFGLPRKIISDRDPRFISKFMQEVCRITGIEHNPSTAYHPRTDGQSERSNQWVETAIRFISDYHQTNWAPYLPIAQFAHNNWPSDTTRKSPFFLLMGYNPRADWISAPSPLPQVTLRLEQLKQARETAQQMMIKAQQSWVKNRDTPKYKEGDQVWLEGKNLRINQPTAKLAPRRHGPFKVIQVMSPVNYRLELPTQWSIHPVFHIDLLTPYKETITHGPNYQRPLPDLVNGEEEYSVEKILDSRLFGRRQRLQYLVKWEGYPDADNMWVDKDDVFADDKVREFKQLNPDKRTHIRTLRYVDSPHPTTTSTSQLLIQHAHKYMSSDGDNDLAHEYPAGAYDDTTARDEHLDDLHQAIVDAATNYTADQLRRLRQPVLLNESFVPLDPSAVPFEPRSPSPSAQSIANAFRQLSIHTPARLTPDGAAAAAIIGTHPYEVSVPASAVVGDEDSESLASGAPRASPAAVRREESTTHHGGTRSRSTSVPDNTHCPRCDGPREYCHGHSPIDNPTLPVPAPPTPLPVPAPALPTHRVATFNLNRAASRGVGCSTRHCAPTRRSRSR